MKHVLRVVNGSVLLSLSAITFILIYELIAFHPIITLGIAGLLVCYGVGASCE